MSIERDKMIKLLESKIENMVKQILDEKKYHAPEKKVLGKKRIDTIEKSDSYKRQYKTIQKELGRPEVDATQIMARALGFDSKDDAARSHAFKKLHRDKTPDGTGNYEFDAGEIGKIANALQSI